MNLTLKLLPRALVLRVALAALLLVPTPRGALAQSIANKNAQTLIGPVWAVNGQRAKPIAADGGADAIDPCQSSDASEPPQSVANSKIRVVYRAVPATISVGKPFSLQATVCPLTANAQVQSFGVDAQMPEHRHGMNYTPKIALLSRHSYRADGLMFHMPGKWQLVFDVRVDERSERLTHDIVIR